MRLPEAWNAVKADPEWRRKILVAAGVNLIPYVGPFVVVGYSLNYARASAAGTWGERLPDWKAWPAHAQLGLLALVASLVYSLPLVLLITPVSVAPAMMLALSPPGRSSSIAAALLTYGVTMILTMVASLFYAPVSYVAMLQVGIHGRIEPAFEFRAVFSRARRDYGRLLSIAARGMALSTGAIAAALALLAAVGAPLVLALQRFPEAIVLLALLAPVAYGILFLIAACVGAPVSLVIHRLLGAYVAETQGPPPPARAAA